MGPKEAALQDMKRIDAEIDALRAERFRVASFVEMYDRYAQSASGTSQDPPKATKKEVIRNITYSLIDNGGGFVQIAAVVEEAKMEGVEFPSEDERTQRAYVASILTREAGLMHVQGRGWTRRAVVPQQDDRPETPIPGLSGEITLS